jgi:hypothetical protein
MSSNTYVSARVAVAGFSKEISDLAVPFYYAIVFVIV